MGYAPGFRCGWRIIRQPPIDRFGFPFVDIRRGTWNYRMDASHFDHMPDEYFAEFMTRAYQDAAFDQIQQDLDVLARQLIGQLERNGGGLMMVTGVPYDDVIAALKRHQAAKDDMQV